MVPVLVLPCKTTGSTMHNNGKLVNKKLVAGSGNHKLARNYETSCAWMPAGYMQYMHRS